MTMQDEVMIEAAKTGALIGYRVLVFLMLLALLAKKPAAIGKPAPNLTGEVSRQIEPQKSESAVYLVKDKLVGASDGSCREAETGKIWSSR